VAFADLAADSALSTAASPGSALLGTSSAPVVLHVYVSFLQHRRSSQPAPP
jgi:hypothetical protein